MLLSVVPALILVLLLSACGYPTPTGGGGLTPYVVVVTPTAPFAAQTTSVATTTAAEITAAPATTSAAASTPAPAATTAAPPSKAPATLAVNGDKYTVQPGDTLYGLAIRLGVDYNDLLDANKGIDPDKLQIGQVIKLPPRTAGQPTPSPTKS
ncbi:MAG TPA: LysM domain-containing protein [Chloroflexia bacterium]|nr:LysM domain-containing protein [Chloroflexia bacterium]